uniref:Uncharacterized protein n=1 Tax=Fibrocapsa japonica TaxID=94617 RepID=A0A7S2UW03_9STRA|mmetsp:Transcript_11465/g.16926  ORF Transcript_11465/g.16926 Transcript_11465/m.16926 type:complete len:240 (+) Transcript_11465:67-786(+)
MQRARKRKGYQELDAKQKRLRRAELENFVHTLANGDDSDVKALLSDFLFSNRKMRNRAQDIIYDSEGFRSMILSTPPTWLFSTMDILARRRREMAIERRRREKALNNNGNEGRVSYGGGQSSSGSASRGGTMFPRGVKHPVTQPMPEQQAGASQDSTLAPAAEEAKAAAAQGALSLVSDVQAEVPPLGEEQQMATEVAFQASEEAHIVLGMSAKLIAERGAPEVAIKRKKKVARGEAPW